MSVDLLKPSRWMASEGPVSDVVISSRIRLARNFKRLPFPQLLGPAEAQKLVQEVRKRIFSIRDQFDGLDFLDLKDLESLERQILVEKHLISPQLAESEKAGAVALAAEDTVSIMVNEEDHLRIQCILPAFQIDEAWTAADKVDDTFESEFDYAFLEKYGYLTSCPTNVGTGLRASVMLHLPALVMTKQAGKLLSALSKVGLTVRGLYGEGSEAIGDIFQVSNQITLGQTEDEIISNLKAVCNQIIDQEHKTRDKLSKSWGSQLEDRVGRALGILLYCKIISSEEAIKLLSEVRLGVGMGYTSNISIPVLNQLLVYIQPSILQKIYNETLEPEERDVKRAQLIKSYLTK
ncbi:MAG: protein arginine kinase [Zhaonellaceae bacterium]